MKSLSRGDILKVGKSERKISSSNISKRFRIKKIKTYDLTLRYYVEVKIL